MYFKQDDHYNKVIIFDQMDHSKPNIFNVFVQVLPFSFYLFQQAFLVDIKT